MKLCKYNSDNIIQTNNIVISTITIMKKKKLLHLTIQELTSEILPALIMEPPKNK